MMIQTMGGESIFREVDHALRTDRLEAFWRRYWLYLVGLAVVFVVSLSSHGLWRWHLQTQLDASGALFEGALMLADEGKIGEARLVLDELVAGGYGQYPRLSRFVLARLAASEGDRAAAREAYRLLSEDFDDETFGALSRIEGFQLSLDMEGDPLLQGEGVRGMTGHSSSLWRSVSKELLGVAAYKQGDIALAGRIFYRLATDPGVPSGIQGRARLMLLFIAQSEGPYLTEEPS